MPAGCRAAQCVWKSEAYLAVALFLQVLSRDEAQRGGVHAVAHAGGRRAVVEDVTQVGVAVPAAHLRARHEEAAVRPFDDVVRFERPGEARPAGAGLILVQGGEERLPGDDVHVDARPVIVPVPVVEGRFRALLLGHVVLQRRQVPPQVSVARFHEVLGDLVGGRGRRLQLDLAVLAPGPVQEVVAPGPRAVELVADRMVLVVVLMVVLSRVEGGCRQYLRHERLLEPAGRRKFPLRLLGQPLLLVVVVEDGRAVLRPPVHELAAGVRRVDLAPEHLQKLRVRDQARVVGDLHGLDVSLLRVVVVGGIGARAARVAGDDVRNAVQFLERRLHAPEAAAGERGRLQLRIGGDDGLSDGCRVVLDTAADKGGQAQQAGSGNGGVWYRHGRPPLMDCVPAGRRSVARAPGIPRACTLSAW